MFNRQIVLIIVRTVKNCQSHYSANSVLISAAKSCKLSTHTASANDEKQEIVSSQTSKRMAFQDIPAATRYPFVGTKLSFLLAGSGTKLHEYIHNRHKKLGCIFREPIGPVEAVFISSPDAMRELFLYDGKYPKHPLPEAWTLYNEVHRCKRGLFFMDDEEWLENRKIMNSLLLRNDLRLAQRVTQTCCAELMTEWNQMLDGKADQFVEVPNLIQTLYLWSIKVVTGLMLGETAQESRLRPMLVEFSETVETVFEHSAPLMTFPPSLAKKYNLQIWQRFDTSVSRTLNLANAIVDIGLQNINKSSRMGLIAEMRALGMSPAVIKRIFVDLIIAAGDTTAYSTQWALMLLARHIEVQNSVRADIFSDPDNMEVPMVRGTVREALRLYPVATFIGRILPIDAVIGNYEIPKHTLVLTSLYTSGRDEYSFPDASEFQPRRWERDINGKLACVRRASSTIPYSLGARNCVGQKIANLQMHIMLSQILKNFHVKLINSQDIHVIMKMIAVPSQKIKLSIKKNHYNPPQ